ncbi:hydroxycinnamoyl-CoA shikimate/quinate hydroxycinnamoyl transferase [Hibiscus trionum]|uniref:Hydroxycinnamoyl-CoA shikimate/quinate hydroxycinnamoyl transferase n=1 Tax=Hibiscus trionum TaxID=183268 RepID=A0A9W7IG25_HIBTR|nr:hydroxycinnamoyl-CoA shikimate/quinate hydroxycinnamoyl transferase [Hibiscus trionum]
MEIIIKESTIVRPAEETPIKSLWNSNLDLLITRFHVPTVYFYKPNGTSVFFDTSRLKEALGKVLVPFYPVAGRLGLDQSGRLEITCNAEGALFVEAETSSVMEHLIGDFTDNSQVFRLVPQVNYSREMSSYPLLLVQVTKFKCGGVCLGIGFQHTLGDATSAVHFINTWADITRGSLPAVTPFIDRTLLRARVPPTPTFHHVEYDPSPPLKTNDDQSDVLKPSNSKVSTFKITIDELNTLKAKANASSGTKYTIFNVLAAHIWRCASKARRLSYDQPTKIYIPVDGRSKLNPPLPAGYLGNVIFMTAQITRAGDLETESFIDTVKRIQGGLKQINDEYLRSSLDYTEKVSDLSTLVRGSHTFRCPNLVVNSWVRLPFYEADFGWGGPIYVGPANVVQEGVNLILPCPSNDGSC